MYSVHASRFFMSFHLAVYIYIFYDWRPADDYAVRYKLAGWKRPNRKHKNENRIRSWTLFHPTCAKTQVPVNVSPCFHNHREVVFSASQLSRCVSWIRYQAGKEYAVTSHAALHAPRGSTLKQLHTQTSHRVLLLEFLETMQSVREKSSIVNTIVTKTCFTKENAA